MIQSLGIHLQETWVQSLAWEDPHAKGQLIPSVTTTEPAQSIPQELQLLSPQALEPRLHKEKPLQGEDYIPQLEKVQAARKTQSSQNRTYHDI